MNVLKAAVIGITALAVATTALAQETREQRIDQGIQSGALTPREANQLEKGQQHVEDLETKAQADGKITAKEKLRLEHAQDVQSKRIYRQKHDKQTQ